MLFPIFQNELRQEIERSTLIRADTNAASLQALHLRDRLTDLIAQSEYSLRVIVNYLPRFREHRRFLSPVEKRQPNLFLEMANGDAHRQLCSKHLVSSLRKAFFLYDSRKVFELGHFHRLNYLLHRAQRVYESCLLLP